MSNAKQTELIKKLEAIDASKLLVHSDSAKTLSLIKAIPNKEAILGAHVKLLESLVRTGGLILPAFNYKFPQEHMFDLSNTKSEVGHISEYFRREVATWRSVDPMFSVCGTGVNPIKNNYGEVCSFGENSIFSNLVKNKGHVLFYGASINSATILHYAEFLSDVGYRYWKTINGEVVVNDKTEKIILNSHFRPRGHHLDYNWTKIKAELESEGILQNFNSVVMGADAKELVGFWCSKLAGDRLYFLDDPSRAWVAPLLEKLGRPFLVTDFES